LYNVLIKGGKPVSSALVDMEEFKKTNSTDGLLVCASNEKESLEVAQRLIDQIKDSIEPI